MQGEGKGLILDQFANPDNPSRITRNRSGNLARYRGADHHFVSSMGTTATIMGVSRFPEGEEPEDPDRGMPARGRIADSRHTQVAGSLPSRIYENFRVDVLEYVSQADAEENGAQNGARGGHLRGHFLWRVARRCPAHSGIAQQRNHRFHRLRSRRPLSVHRRFPGLDDATVAQISRRLLEAARQALGRAVLMTPTLVFDIETVPDIAGAAHGCTPWDRTSATVKWRSSPLRGAGRRRARTFCRCICTASSPSPARCASATLSGSGRWGTAQDSEAELVRRFFDGIDKYTPQLVSWNGGVLTCRCSIIVHWCTA